MLRGNSVLPRASWRCPTIRCEHLSRPTKAHCRSSTILFAAGARRSCVPSALPGRRTRHRHPELVDLIAGGAFAAAVICPSNPYLSVDPILAVPGIAAALARARTPIIAVSPIIGGQAVKGPTAKIMAELGIAITNQSIASHYRGLIDGLVIDEADLADRERIEVPALVTRTVMRDLADRERLAGEVIAFAETITHRPAKRAGERR